MLPWAPPLLSTTICCLNMSVSLGAMMREMASVPPPGGVGTSQRIGRDGYEEPGSAAHAGAPVHNATRQNALRNALVHRFMCFPGSFLERCASILYWDARRTHGENVERKDRAGYRLDRRYRRSVRARVRCRRMQRDAERLRSCSASR